FSHALHAALLAWDRRVPRGKLSPEERAQAARWHDALVFAGQVWRGQNHVVALGPSDVAAVVPPPGRHVYVMPVERWEQACTALGNMARYVVAVGTDDPARVAGIAPTHARLSVLGRMQRPPLDGPVDRRAS